MESCLAQDVTVTYIFYKRHMENNIPKAEHGCSKARGSEILQTDEDGDEVSFSSH